ncbi:isochorismate synthase [Bacillus carboniphilus]|uniref:Isochorismate synthase MenF n=1 Tax=Bacillus carboniphilus TaxID=86663 RepID=A0ABY9JP92_9BACI|nr:isochorismate synthase [Bacillus carboniphilus]WLR41201.1 isochorismate synthase [Bacillus carboniphilus]
MVSTQQEESLRQKVSELIQKVKKHSCEQIISEVREINRMDPLQVFRAFRHNKGQRSYWSTPNQEFTQVGIGHELVFKNDSTLNTRFFTIEAQWHEWRRSSYLVGPRVIGTGAILIGGVSFDPKKKLEDKWNDFGEGLFFMPSFLYTLKGQKAFLTINKVVKKEDTVKSVMDYFHEIQHLFTVELNRKPIDDHEASVICEEYYVSEWKRSIEKATTKIKEGTFEKVILAREIMLRFEHKKHVEPVIEKLQREQSASYIYAIESNESTFLGASPERLIKKEEQKVFSTCLAGSIKRGKDREEDHQLGNDLLGDHKNLHEHQIVVNMIRENFSERCITYQCQKKPTLLKTRSVQHLYTPIMGIVKKGYSLFDFVESLHPTPALGGFPRQAAMKYIRDEEPMERGWYAAPIGWLDFEDNGEFIVAIRSGLIQNNRAFLFAGCGIVRDSDPELEYEETIIKLKPMLSAVGGLNNVRD